MIRAFALRSAPAWIVNGATVTAGLALVQVSTGLAAGSEAAQIAVASAVCTSLADVVTTTDRVARRVLAAWVAGTASASIFLAVRPHEAWLIPAVALIVFGAMLIQSWGPKAGSVSFAATLSLVFAMSLPASQMLSWHRLGWSAVGSAGYWIWATATARLLQPTWRNLALASAAQGLADLLAAIGRQIGQPASKAWQSDLLEAEAAFAERLQAARDLVFGNDQGARARFETALLLHLIDLRDLALASRLGVGTSATQFATRREAELTSRVVKEIADSLQTIAMHLRHRTSLLVDARNERAIADLLHELECSAPATGGEPVAGVGKLLRSKLEIHRSLQQLMEPGARVELAVERTDLRRYITPDEWRVSAVMANLHVDAPVFRHAVRTCVTATAGYALSRAVPWTLHPQWVLLTIMTVMQGNLALTLLRRNARVAGTVAGCFVVLALTTASSSSMFLAACFLGASGVAHAFLGVRYSVTAAAAAVMALLQAHAGAPASGFGAFERIGDTLAGALLGWLATYALPTWERRNLGATLRQAVEALRAYAAEATTLHDVAGAAPRFARQRAYDAVRTLAATRTRSLAEPSDVRVPIPALTAWLGSAYGLMAQLSNLRLSLVLNERRHVGPELLAAIDDVSRELDARLRAPSAPQPGQPDACRVHERALASVPHLPHRARHALELASQVAGEAAAIEALIRTCPDGGDGAVDA